MTGHRPGGRITPPARFATTGYQWGCLTTLPERSGSSLHIDCDGSCGGFETDFRAIWRDARKHKDEHPDHEVVVDRMQRSWLEAAE